MGAFWVMGCWRCGREDHWMGESGVGWLGVVLAFVVLFFCSQW